MLMKKVNFILIGLTLLLCFCKNTATDENINEHKVVVSNENIDKIKVLNFATFHMGFTTDANTTEFDENNKANQQSVHEIAAKLALFEPTVILVELVPTKNEALQSEYKQYLEKPDMFFQKPSEIELLAYEVGRLSKVKRIYGIDHKMNYNYRIGNQIENAIDSTWHKKFYSNPFKFYPEINNKKQIKADTDLLAKLKRKNHDSYLDFLIAANADMLSFVGTKEGFEGADEAAKYYQRNLRMYSNFNRINLTKEDRVFILMGSSHTAFFRDFISRSPKYQMVNTFDFLK